MTEKPRWLAEENTCFAVFGCGYAAGLLLRGLERAGALGRVRCHLVSGPAEEGETFRGRPVVSLSRYRRGEDERILVAVHESSLADVLPAVRGKDPDAVWTGPDVWKLLFGAPVRQSLRLPAGLLLQRQDPSYRWLAARLACAESLADGGEAGTELYLAALSRHCSASSAEKRLAAFRRLFESVRADGLREEHPIAADSEGRIIDGLHRLTLAVYFGIPYISCDIYPSSPEYDEVFTARNTLAGWDAAECSGEAGAALLSAQEKIGAARRAYRPAISAILPVYNVHDCIGKCLESLSGQTFPDFEALLVDDGSSDGSSEDCRAHCRGDLRFRYIRKENGGVSSARNRGIEEAAGEYLAFVDPDDWVDAAYFEKLYHAAKEEDADFAECDIWRVDGRTGRMIYRSCGSTMGVPYSKEEHMIYGPTALYKSISKRALWEKNAIRLPSCSFESPAVYALILACADKIVSVPEALYYYRRFRPGSLIETGYADKAGKMDPRLGIDAMAHLLGEFRRLSLYDRYRGTLERAVRYRLGDILAMQFHRRGEEEFRALAAEMAAFLEEAFPPARENRYLMSGGYNLSKILTHTLHLHNPYIRFSFSSLAAIGSAAAAAGGTARKEQPGREVRHKNRYREIMLRREINGAFTDAAEKIRPEVFVLDLTEERFDLLYDGGRYYTASDALDGAEGGPDRVFPDAERIAAGSARAAEAFAQGVSAVLAYLRRISPGIRVILVETYLSEKVGNLSGWEYYSELDRIRRDNAVLKERYARFKALCPEAAVVPAWRTEPYLTDRDYEYGALPQHLNGIVNRRIAAEIDAVWPKPEERPQKSAGQLCTGERDSL